MLKKVSSTKRRGERREGGRPSQLSHAFKWPVPAAGSCAREINDEWRGEPRSQASFVCRATKKKVEQTCLLSPPSLSLLSLTCLFPLASVIALLLEPSVILLGLLKTLSLRNKRNSSYQGITFFSLSPLSLSLSLSSSLPNLIKQLSHSLPPFLSLSSLLPNLIQHFSHFLPLSLPLLLSLLFSSPVLLLLQASPPTTIPPVFVFSPPRVVPLSVRVVNVLHDLLEEGDRSEPFLESALDVVELDLEDDFPGPRVSAGEGGRGGHAVAGPS